MRRLAGLLIVFLLFTGQVRLRQAGVVVGDAPTTITWTNQTHTSGWPGSNGFLELAGIDPLTGQLLHYGIPSSSTSIYSTNMFQYDTANNDWDDLGGNNSVDNTASCATSNTGSWPKDGHPNGFMAIDTFRNRLYLGGRLCGGSQTSNDMWYWTLHGDPTNNTWTKISTATNAGPNGGANGAMVYSPDDDVIFMFGYDGGACTNCNTVYCEVQNTAAGCNTVQDYNIISVTGGTIPDAWSFPRLVYNEYINKVLLYGGQDSGGANHYNDIWEYTISTKTWVKKNPVTKPTVLPLSVDSPPSSPFDCIPTSQYCVFHQTHGTGAPRDWLYDAVNVSWTLLTTVGGGPVGVGNNAQAVMKYDPGQAKFLTWSRNVSNGEPEVWHGVLSQ